MYISTTLGEPRSACNFRPPFSSAERNIAEKDASLIVSILGGASPWQRYLQRNLAAHMKDLPARPMRIVTEGEFAKAYSGVFGQPPPAHVPQPRQRRHPRRGRLSYLDLALAFDFGAGLSSFGAGSSSG